MNIDRNLVDYESCNKQVVHKLFKAALINGMQIYPCFNMLPDFEPAPRNNVSLGSL